MRILLTILLFGCLSTFAQQKKAIDSTRRAPQAFPAVKKVDVQVEKEQDSIVKSKLIKLALNNPDLKMLDANTAIAEANKAYAKMSWLSNVSIGANVNEFVIRNSPAASFFPKYNIGFNVPLDVLMRTKRDKRVADENINIVREQKKNKSNDIISEVLIRYENYKEKKEIVLLQKEYMEFDYSAYEASQQSYTEGSMSLEDMNRTYQVYLTEKAKLASKQKDFNVAVIMLEQLIGVPLNTVLINE